jgi:predicted RNase H-like nuclease (RuvC/YqgF family)
MRTLMTLIATLLLAGATGAAAQQAGAQTAERDGRYSMTPAPDGSFLRLDTRTGQVSHCRIADGSAQCRSAADERAALQAEIDRLSKENEDLRKKTAQASPGDRLRNALPSDQEIDTALNWMERLMRRMMSMIRGDQTQDRI